jgi:K+-transporting ATPase c subunit
MATKRSSSLGRVPLRGWLFYFSTLALLLLYFWLIARFSQDWRPREGVQVPDDVQIARELLAQKFTGSQYFQIGEGKDQIPYPYISVVNARTQIERIVKERKLVPAAGHQINQIIEKLTVPAPPRMVGLDHVNALQLNLALDQLR